jgi:hypothetical protein
MYFLELAKAKSGGQAVAHERWAKTSNMDRRETRPAVGRLCRRMIPSIF